MGLLDLVEDHDRVRAAAQGFGQLAGVVVADVAGRGADQAAGGVAFHELGHVELDQGVLAAEHELGQGLGQLGLADAGRAEEDEGTDRAARVLQAGARPPDGLGDGLDGLVLADDGLLELLFHFEQALGFLLGDLHDRHAGPHGDHLGDVVGGDHRAVGALPAGLQPAQLLVQVGLLGLPGPHILGLAFFLGQGAVLARLLQLGIQVLGRLGGVRLVHAHARGGFVDQVDGLIGQEAVRDVAGREAGGGLQRFVRDDQVVVVLVHLADAPQDLDRLVHGGFVHHDGLEAALQGGVRFDMLAILVQRGGADDLQLAAREGWL